MRQLHWLTFGPSALVAALLLAYLIWFRRIVLDMPIGLRIALSVLPCVVLYRIVVTLQRFGSMQPRFTSFAILVALFIVAALYHLWRDVQKL
jgi:hypothetical protein